MSLLTRLRGRPPGDGPDPAPGDGPDPAPGDAPGAGGYWRLVRRVAARVITVLACLLVLFAVIVPNELTRLTPAGFVRIPVEAILGVALVLVVPARARAVVAGIAGAVLGLVTILKVLDMGFFSVLARPFDPVFDWPFLAAAVGYVRESYGPAGANGVVAAAVVLAAAVLALLTLSAIRVSRLVVRHRTRAAGTLAVLGAAWVACAVLGVQVIPDAPVAASGLERVLQVRESLQDREAFAAESAVDAFRDTPTEELLTALRGKDVVIAFVEAYGRDAVEDPEFAPQVGAVLDTGSRRLEAAGFHSRSAFLTSPTAGGGSWLAHATLLSGLWIDNQQRYRTLVGSDRLTLNSAFHQAGWRTVALMPGILEDWPEGEFFGYDRVYASHSIGYNGPRVNWGRMPDQYTLSAFERFERGSPDRAPVMAEIPLVSSHAPWTPIPELIDWDDVGDGSGFEPGGPPEDGWQNPARARANYGRAVAYSVSSIISYLETYGDDDLVMVFLGDHPPTRLVVGEDPNRDVPISIVARDPAVLDRIAGWGWQDGLKPGPQAPVWRMDAFRDRFLTAFGGPPAR